VAGSKYSGNDPELGLIQIDWKTTDDVYEGCFVYSAVSQTVVLFEGDPNVELTVDKGVDQPQVRGVDASQLSTSSCNHAAVAVVNHADKPSNVDLSANGDMGYDRV
jgi:hypothetical protein